jgi:hypothetical protein
LRVRDHSRVLYHHIACLLALWRTDSLHASVLRGSPQLVALIDVNIYINDCACTVSSVNKIWEVNFLLVIFSVATSSLIPPQTQTTVTVFLPFFSFMNMLLVVLHPVVLLVISFTGNMVNAGFLAFIRISYSSTFPTSRYPC